MGPCFSAQNRGRATLPTAKVVTDSGHLRQYSTPVTVAEAILHLEPLPSSLASSSSYFLCSSDRLFFDEAIPALLPGDILQLGQIYFSLPGTMLRHPLKAEDMVVLAVRASGALAEAEMAEGGGKRQTKKLRVSPFLDVGIIGGQGDYVDWAEKRIDKSGKVAQAAAPAKFSRSRSMRKLQRSASRRAKMAVRSFKMRLSTINEGTLAA